MNPEGFSLEPAHYPGRFRVRKEATWLERREERVVKDA